MAYIIECITISIPIVLSALGVVIAIIALLFGIKVVKLEKHSIILEKHKHLLILQLVLFGDGKTIKGYEALEILKNKYHTKDDYEALNFYYNDNKDT